MSLCFCFVVMVSVSSLYSCTFSKLLGARCLVDFDVVPKSCPSTCSLYFQHLSKLSCWAVVWIWNILDLSRSVFVSSLISHLFQAVGCSVFSGFRCRSKELFFNLSFIFSASFQLLLLSSFPNYFLLFLGNSRTSFLGKLKKKTFLNLLRNSLGTTLLKCWPKTTRIYQAHPKHSPGPREKAAPERNNTFHARPQFGPSPIDPGYDVYGSGQTRPSSSSPWHENLPSHLGEGGTGYFDMARGHSRAPLLVTGVKKCGARGRPGSTGWFRYGNGQAVPRQKGPGVEILSGAPLMKRSWRWFRNWNSLMADINFWASLWKSGPLDRVNLIPCSIGRVSCAKNTKKVKLFR